MVKLPHGIREIETNATSWNISGKGVSTDYIFYLAERQNDPTP